MKKKEINIPKLIWVTSIFAFLIVILIMVMDYKINYEYSTNNSNKLYFYDCDNELCTSLTKAQNKKLYSEYECYNKCPKYSGRINENYALLKTSNGIILYNYKEGIKIAEDYDEYEFINNNYFIVTKNKLDGIMDIESNVIIKPTYTKIGYYKNKNLIGYNTTSIIVKSENKYGIVNYKTGEIIEEIKYTKEEIDKLLKIINK